MFTSYKYGRFSNGLWLLIFLIPLLVPTTNAGLHYAVALGISVFIFSFYRTPIYNLFATLVLIAYLITFIILGSDLSALRYVVVFLLITQLRFVPIDSLNKAAVILVLINSLWALLEMVIPNGSFRLIFRSSLQEFHIYRTSGLFAFPGDLGHFAVSFFTYFFVFRPNIKIPLLHYFQRMGLSGWGVASILCLFLLFTCQSRLSFIQLAIALILISLRQSLLPILSILGLGVVFLMFVIDFKYLLSTDWLGIYDALTNVNSQSKFKRVSDLSLLFSGQVGFFPAPLPDDVDFVESGFVSQYFRMGGLLSVFTVLTIFITGVFAYLRAEKGTLILAASIVTLSLLATNFVGAPFERPKLMFYNLLFISILFHFVYALRKNDPKNTKPI